MSNLEQHPAGWGMRSALAFVFVWFFVGGIAHFLFVEAQMIYAANDAYAAMRVYAALGL